MLSLLLFFMTSSPRRASAQTSNSANATVTVSVVPAVSITSSGGSDGAGNLDFGLVIVNSTASIHPNTSSSASLYTIGGGAGMAMTVSYSSPTLALSDTLGNQLTFTPQVVGSQSSGSQSSASSKSSGASITLSGTGSYYLWLGGSVSVPSGQAGGTYTGTFDLTVSY